MSISVGNYLGRAYFKFSVFVLDELYMDFELYIRRGVMFARSVGSVFEHGHVMPKIC
jgi:hypothetical protein